METFLLEAPVAGVVCEQPVLCEQRSANREPDGWHIAGKAVKRSYQGHQLALEPLSLEGKTLGWFMWMDRHYRGVSYTDVDAAEHLLENEVERAISAWGRKQAWLAMGAPERRRPR